MSSSSHPTAPQGSEGSDQQRAGICTGAQKKGGSGKKSRGKAKVKIRMSECLKKGQCIHMEGEII